MDKIIYDKNTEWYKKVYNNLIEKGKFRGLKRKLLNYYTEKHHIIPKCLGGTNNIENLVLLTYKEHLIAHMLLSRIYHGNIKLKHVVYFMLNSSKNKSTKIHNLDLLGEIREASIEYLREIHTGKTLSLEIRKKISQSKSNKKLSEDAKKSMAEGRVGMIFSEDRKAKISNSMKGKTISEETRKKQSISQGQKVQTPEGIIYNTLKECSEALNISKNVLYHWIKEKPEKGFKYVSYSGPIKVIDPDGEIHNSIRKCAIKYKRESKTIKNWIENYPDKGFRYYK